MKRENLLNKQKQIVLLNNAEMDISYASNNEETK